MLNELGCKSVADQWTDARLIYFFFWKNVHDYVAIQIQPYTEPPLIYTGHRHSLKFRLIHSSPTYYEQSFYPATIVLKKETKTRCSSDVVLLENQDSFREGSPTGALNLKHCFIFFLNQTTSQLTISAFIISHYCTFYLLQSFFYPCIDSANCT